MQHAEVFVFLLSLAVLLGSATEAYARAGFVRPVLES